MNCLSGVPHHVSVDLRGTFFLELILLLVLLRREISDRLLIGGLGFGPLPPNDRDLLAGCRGGLLRFRSRLRLLLLVFQHLLEPLQDRFLLGARLPLHQAGHVCLDLVDHLELEMGAQESAMHQSRHRQKSHQIDVARLALFLFLDEGEVQEVLHKLAV